MRSAAEHLYLSLIASRDVSRQRLGIIQDLERRHRHIPLADLVALAAAGVLREAGQHPDGQHLDGQHLDGTPP